MDTQTSTNTNVFCKHIKNAKPKILCNVLLNLYKRAVSERKGYLYSCVSVIKALNFHFSMGWWWRRRSVEKKSLGIFRVPCEFYLAYFPSRIETLLNILLWKLFQKKNNLTFSSSSSSFISLPYSHLNFVKVGGWLFHEKAIVEFFMYIFYFLHLTNFTSLRSFTSIPSLRLNFFMQKHFQKKLWI